QGPAPARMPTRPALPTEETSAQRFRRKVRALIPVEIKASPATLPGKAPEFQSARAPSGAAANAALVGGTRSPVFPSSAPAASSTGDTRVNRRRVVPQ